MANDHKKYMQKPPDMSGSIAKNRFRAELLWGVEKLLNCLDEGIEGFAVVFDYQCDIELHLDDSYEFYQIKTSNERNFGVSWACRKKPSSSVSIVGKLYELHDAGDEGKVRLIIVGNRPFVNSGDLFKDQGELLFSSLNDADKQKIEKAIGDHLPNVTPDINKLSYVLIAMDLTNPDNAIRGHLTSTYENVMGYEARKPNALYRALRGLVEEKACEERTQKTYDDVIKKKAVTHAELEHLFEQYADAENSQYDFVMGWISKQPPLQQSTLKCAYEDIIGNLYKPRGSSALQLGIDSIRRLDNALSESEIISRAANKIQESCDLEVTQDMCKIYAALALYEVMEGAQ